MNETIQTLIHRRSIRKYTEEPVTDAHLDLVLQAGLYAPNSHNHQHPRILVLRDREGIEALGEAVRQEIIGWDEQGEHRNKIKSIRRARTPGYHFLFGAPVLVAAVCPKDHPGAMADCALMLGNMLAAAASLALGGCYVNQLYWLSDHPAVRPMLEGWGMLPEESVFGSMALGHPGVGAPSPPPRKPGRIVITG